FGTYLERICPIVAILHTIHPRFLHLCEIKLQILITQKSAPFFRSGFNYFLCASIFIDTMKNSFRPVFIVSVELDDRQFLLAGMITHLRYLDNWVVLPVGQCIWS